MTNPTPDAREQAIRQRLNGRGECYVCGEQQYGRAHLGCTERNGLNADLQALFVEHADLVSSLRQQLQHQTALAEAHRQDSDTIDQLEAEGETIRDGWQAVKELRQQLATYKTLASVGAWHDECRPNRQQAAETIAKQQAENDKLADAITELRQQLRAQQEHIDKIALQAAREQRRLEKEIEAWRTNLARMADLMKSKDVDHGILRDKATAENVAIRQQVETLTQERDEARENVRLIDLDLGVAIREATAMEVSRDAALEALREHGRHKPSCGYNQRVSPDGDLTEAGDACSCGLWATLSTAERRSGDQL